MGGLAPADITVGCGCDMERYDRVARGAGIVCDDTVLKIEALVDFVDHAIVADRFLVRGEVRHPFRHPGGLGGRQRRFDIAPTTEAGTVGQRFDLIDQCRDGQFGVTDQSDSCRFVLVDVIGVDRIVDDLFPGRNCLAVGRAR